MSVRPGFASEDHRADSRADQVVLVDGADREIGRADRMAVHTTETPLHRAFSTYLFNARGEVLVTRRALSKKTWPGVWTNSCCGHPRPGESLEEAARRRIRQELGLNAGPFTLLVPDFRYRAVDASGIVENELCPVLATFVTDDQPFPDPAEVSEWAWVPWESLVTAAAATPQVYSPWAVLQIPLVNAALPRLAESDPGPSAAVADAIDAVDDLLARELARLADEWSGYLGDLDVDVLPDDLPGWLGKLLVGRGKRLRVAMAYWGFVAAGGSPYSSGYTQLIRAAAALETLHLFALIHDDVMDDSDSRRGRPAAHVEAAGWHRASAGLGDSDHFGRNLAVLLGDLAHSMADELAAGLPAAMRTLWHETCIELIAGQRADLTGAAAGRRDRAHAERVAAIKSGRYTITRPLHLGATAAGASTEILDALSGFGDHIGRAFALRDDYLGVWGDPVVTGKPAGDDLVEGKATVLLSLAADLLDEHGRAVLHGLGTREFSAEDVRELTQVLQEAGVDAAVERQIDASVRAAVRVLTEAPVSEEGKAGLIKAAAAVAWRSA